MLLENSSELKEILMNKHVRDILQELDSCSQPDKLLEQAMQEPIFVEFADACLKIVQDEQAK